MWFMLNLYLQQVLGYGPFEAGSALLPMTALIMLLMVGAIARIIGRFGLRAPPVVGLGVLAVGIGLFGLITSDGGFVPDVLWAPFVAAAGMSLAYVPALNAAFGRRPGTLRACVRTARHELPGRLGAHDSP